jgi:hypothetical protein
MVAGDCPRDCILDRRLDWLLPLSRVDEQDPAMTGGLPRSRSELLEVIASLDVEHNPAFQRRDITGDGIDETFCNQALEAWLTKLGLWLPPGLLARQQLAWLGSPEARALGWYECTLEKAAELAELGQPVVAGWVNPDPKRPSHVGLVAPRIGGTGTYLAQAGAANFSNRPIEKGFGVEKLKTTKFHTHP